MINSTTNSLINTGLSSLETSQLSQAGSASDKSTEETKEHSERSEILLSSRAKKVKAFSEEFFSGSGLANVDIDKLKERAYEYGLISENEFKWLQGDKSRAEVNEAEAAKLDLTKSLSGHLTTLIERIEKANKELPEDKQQDTSGVTERFQKAADILKDVEAAMSKDGFADNLKDAIAGLKELIEADSFNSLGLEDRVSLTHSASALQIVEKIGPRQLSNEKLNQYIAFSNR